MLATSRRENAGLCQPRRRKRLGRATFLCLLLAAFALLLSGCRTGTDADAPFVMVMESQPGSLDPLRGNDAQSERLRQLMFNSLVRKNEQLEYVGELATDPIQVSEDRRTYTFTLREGVTFHDGRPLTSADAKYTLEALLASDSPKATPFFVGTGEARQPRIEAIETPDPRTLVIRLRESWLELFVNLVPIPIIAQGSSVTETRNPPAPPMGSGPFRFASRDEAQQSIDMEAYENYWEGASNVKRLRVRVVLDTGTLQSELLSGRVDLAVNTSLSPDAYEALAQNPNLKVEQAPGTNIVYLGFNTQNAPLNDARVRQAAAYAINREQLVQELMRGQARIAHSILPPESWAYSAGQQYTYDPARARQILDEAGYRATHPNGMRFAQPIGFLISASSATINRYASVIQNQLREVGLPVEIATMEDNTLRQALVNGQYQITTSRWVGGNQDPVFLRDLFMSTSPVIFNRSRYNNPQLDPILRDATAATDRERARTLYVQAQEIISRDVPMLPLWYPSNIVVARRHVGNIRIDASGDWRFVRSVTVER